MITLSKFLSGDMSAKLVQKPGAVMCVQTEGSALLFCQKLIQYLADSTHHTINSQPMASDNMGSAMASLQTEFLGQRSCYWLHADDALPKKSYDSWHTFLQSYTGPHSLIFCATKPIAKPPRSWTVVNCPREVDVRLFKQLAQLFGIKNSLFVDQLFKTVRSVPLDTVVLLCHYGTLVGKNNKQFISDWLPSLVVPDQSLFALSQALLARKPKTFLTQWKELGSSYPLQFWLTFWSEQIWRAYCYVRLQKAGKLLDAKKIGYRLPFSFLNNDWRLHSLEQLAKAHKQIYSFDYHVKQGGSEQCLELLYSSFFSN